MNGFCRNPTLPVILNLHTSKTNISRTLSNEKWVVNTRSIAAFEVTYTVPRIIHAFLLIVIEII